MPRSMPVTLLAVALLGSQEACATSRTSGATAPSPAPVVCPASLTAEVAAEPVPPTGIDPAALPPELTRFLWGEWLPWARGNAVRLAQGQKWCEGH